MRFRHIAEPTLALVLGVVLGMLLTATARRQPGDVLSVVRVAESDGSIIDTHYTIGTNVFGPHLQVLRDGTPFFYCSYNARGLAHGAVFRWPVDPTKRPPPIDIFLDGIPRARAEFTEIDGVVLEQKRMGARRAREVYERVETCAVSLVVFAAAPVSDVLAELSTIANAGVLSDERLVFRYVSSDPGSEPTVSFELRDGSVLDCLHVVAEITGCELDIEGDSEVDVTIRWVGTGHGVTGVRFSGQCSAAPRKRADDSGDDSGERGGDGDFVSLSGMGERLVVAGPGFAQFDAASLEQRDQGGEDVAPAPPLLPH